MKGSTVWYILSCFVSILIAVTFSGRIAQELGWAYWLAFALVFLDVLFVLVAPVTARKYYAAWQLNEAGYGKRGQDLGGISCLAALFYFTISAVVPGLVLVWLISVLLK